MRVRETLRRRWWQFGIGIAGAVALLLTAGVWFFLHVIEGSPAKPLALSNVTTTTTVAGTTGSVGSGSSVDGSWTVTTSGTEVGYRVKETLFGQSAVAAGRTSAVTGSMTISGTTVSAAKFTVDMTQVTSDKSGRDSQFQGRIMDTSSFPTATFELTSPLNFSSIPTVGTKISEQATGKLTLHGTTKNVTFTVNAQRTNTGVEVQGQIPITFSDYSIDNPSGGPASVGNSGTLEFLLELIKS
jgi:polyisoprenoid-binding protein YceI